MSVVALITLALGTQSNPPVGELGEVLQRPAGMTVTSLRSAAALELCVGDAISKWGVPTALRGDGETVVSAWLSTNFGAHARVAVRIAEEGNQRTLTVRTRRGNPEAELREAIEGCR